MHNQQLAGYYMPETVTMLDGIDGESVQDEVQDGAYYSEMCRELLKRKYSHQKFRVVEEFKRPFCKNRWAVIEMGRKFYAIAIDLYLREPFDLGLCTAYKSKTEAMREAGKIVENSLLAQVMVDRMIAERAKRYRGIEEDIHEDIY